MGGLVTVFRDPFAAVGAGFPSVRLVLAGLVLGAGVPSARAGLTGWDPFDLWAMEAAPPLAPTGISPWQALQREGDASAFVVADDGFFSPRPDNRVLRLVGDSGELRLVSSPAPSGVGRAGTFRLRARIRSGAEVRVEQAGAILVAGSTGGEVVDLVLVVNPTRTTVLLDDGSGRELLPGRWMGWVGSMMREGQLDEGAGQDGLPVTIAFAPSATGAEAWIDDVRWDDRAFGPAGPLWLQAAEQRIHALRTSELVVEAVDVRGLSLAGVRVKVDQLESAFPFGTAIRDGYDFASAPAWYKELVLAWFDQVTLEGGLRWPQWESPSRRENTLRWLDWAAANGLRVRGHVLVYPQPQHLPADVAAMLASGNGAGAAARAEGHLASIVPSLRGRITTWDVLNEPVQSQAIQTLVGPEVEARWFALARAHDPSASLAVNQNNIVASSTNLATFRERLDRLVSLGADFDRIGVQGHFRNERAERFPEPEDYASRLAELAAYGKAIDITEFDVFNSNPEHPIQWSVLDEARISEEFATLSFSHPLVASFTVWGFWDGAHWQNNAPFLDTSRVLKPSGRMLLDLFRGRWWTRHRGYTDATGAWVGSAFHGRLRVEVGEGSGRVVRDVEVHPGVGRVLQVVVGRTWLADWKQSRWPGGGGTPGSGDADDPDRDGVANLFEFAFGLDPMTPQPGPSASIVAGGTGLAAFWTLDPAASGLAWQVEGAPGPGGPWTLRLSGTLPDLNPTGHGPGVIRVPIPQEGGFLRLRLAPGTVQ